MFTWFRRQFRPAAVLLVLLVALFSTGCSNSGRPAAADTAGQLVIKVLDIGQGDAILVRAGGQVTLIDTGDTPAKEKLAALLSKEGITAVDRLILTHPHSDHIGGATTVLERFPVKQVYDSGQTTTTATYRKYMQTVEKKKVPFALLAAGDVIDIGGGAKLKVFAPQKPFFTEDNGQLDLNNNSIVAKLMYGSFSMMFTGDAEKNSELQLVKNSGSELKSSILKVGHHGSNTSSSPEFLKAVGAEAAIISLGEGNDYHHPHPVTLKKLEKQKYKIYRTDLNGTVTVTSDGKTYTIGKEKE
ncbi:competence protein ComEC [Anaerospora hongkongensis]|uniref:Competence protein ComEC n=1 Tax=Anaerospora hongkongensis TaxID=244830 RepID=A0A4R1Q0I8_9FIRM|nr:ComEC/Rec2 family competence protein [Anaerospora hongkongensis]TCL39190.1 competence protein ComEC [Anaerospora hongkongensis]